MLCFSILTVGSWLSSASVLMAEGGLQVGAAAVNLQCDETMVISGSIEPRYVKDQEGELRSVAIVLRLPDQPPVGIVACDVLCIPKSIIDPALAEVEAKTGIKPGNVLVNATHTHHAPSAAPIHGSGASPEFCEILKQAIAQSLIEAYQNLSEEDCDFYFHLGEEKTVGGNSRLKLPDGKITWINPLKEAGENVVPTGPFDPQLPVLDFRTATGESRALIYNHSTHTIGTRSGNVRSPSFYGLAAQELETELGGTTVAFLEGASGSTHNIAQVPVAEAVERMKQVIRSARE
ncbi:MAG: hypothetical protein CMJ46_10905 [Planctomyces sp.]|nr:hypothetical protein [Planctomyces sp.]